MKFNTVNLRDISTKLGKYTSKPQMLVIILVTILFIIAALYTYRRYVAEGFSNANNEFKTDNPPMETAAIYYFYTTWCPHCKTATPEWDSFVDEMKDKTVKGVKLSFYKVDCDKEKATADKFNVKGFPTIKLMNGNQMIEYDAKPKKETLIEFVNQSL
jgi:thioredoxin domain-containing protein 10